MWKNLIQLHFNYSICGKKLVVLLSIISLIAPIVVMETQSYHSKIWMDVSEC